MSNRPLTSLPMYSFDLVDELDELLLVGQSLLQFPPRCIGENESPESAHRYAGMRAVVDKLLHLKKKVGEQQKE